MLTGPVSTHLMVGGVGYVIPKVLNYLCGKPETSGSSSSASFGVQGVIEKLRNHMSVLREKTEEWVGNRAWFAATDIIADNAWISMLAISYLGGGKNPFTSLEKGVQTISTFAGFCTMAWLVRFGFIKICPKLGPYIGTRNCQ